MYLEDRLKICLLAIESRHPDHVVDINEAVLDSQEHGAKGWCARDIIAYLEQSAPKILNTMARLVVDIQRSEIYLLEYSEELPAFLVHCRGKLPCRQEKNIAQQHTEGTSVHLVKM